MGRFTGGERNRTLIERVDFRIFGRNQIKRAIEGGKENRNNLTRFFLVGGKDVKKPL